MLLCLGVLLKKLYYYYYDDDDDWGESHDMYLQEQ